MVPLAIASSSSFLEYFENADFLLVSDRRKCAHVTRAHNVNINIYIESK